MFSLLFLRHRHAYNVKVRTLVMNINTQWRTQGENTWIRSFIHNSCCCACFFLHSCFVCHKKQQQQLILLTDAAKLHRYTRTHSHSLMLTHSSHYLISSASFTEDIPRFSDVILLPSEPVDVPSIASCRLCHQVLITDPVIHRHFLGITDQRALHGVQREKGTRASQSGLSSSQSSMTYYIRIQSTVPCCLGVVNASVICCWNLI